MTLELKKVLWVEGTFLSQQHFQQWDRYLENRERLFRTEINPLQWGIIECQIEEESLKLGIFRLCRFKGIFQSGLWVTLKSAGVQELTLTLSPFEHSKGIIYLCLPKGQKVFGINGYPSTIASNLQTWKAEYIQVEDEFDKAREREVLFGRPNIRLELVKEGLDFSLKNQMEWLPLAKVCPVGEGRFVLDNNYIPPLVHLNSHLGFMSKLLQLEVFFLTKVQEIILLKEDMSNRVFSGTREIYLYSLLQILNVAVVRLRHFLENSWIHPEKVYFCLLEMMGELYALSKTSFSNSTFKYDHSDLEHVFLELERQIKTLLEEIIPERLKAITLYRESETIYSTLPADNVIFRKSTFFLMVSTRKDERHWEMSFEKEVKVASKGDIAAVVASALPGVLIKHTVRPPSILPIKSGYEYFQLEPIGEFWEKIKEEGNLSIFVSVNFIEADIILITVEE